MRGVLFGLLGVALVGSSCSKPGEKQTNAAVQTAIERYLQNQPKISAGNMTMEVQQVKVQGDRAEADVKFRSKQDVNLAVAVHYVLRRTGEQWEVESSSAAGGMGGGPHGGTSGQAPSPHPSAPALQPSH